MTLNIRGLGVGGKGSWVRECKRVNEIEFLLLQETQCSYVNGINLVDFWGNSEFLEDHVDASGRSGGLINLWDKKVFDITETVWDRNFLLSRGFLKGDGSEVNVLNVYGPQNVVEKWILWGKIGELISRFQGLWVVAGDFNSVRVRVVTDMRNSMFNSLAANDFNSFINDVILHEYALKVSKTLEEFEGFGAPDVRLMSKFRKLRQAINTSKDEVKMVENEDEVINRNEIEELEQILDDRNLSKEENWIWVESKKRLLELDRFKRLDLRQPARNKWAGLGDENTKYFHGAINKRKAVNSIMGLKINGVWVSKPVKVKKEVYNYFRNRFVERWKVWLKLVCQKLGRLSDEEGVMLIDSFSDEEIKEAVFGCGDDKAPGPDGFNSKLANWK
ncbi:uncharacterized protein LOC118485908 [Helianthus annuus]|uniref:uncharacterized protein LOC118485908 n=1 Tax=Helianthus annuus TaxID=4232 RepID=UPI001652BECD|nr:uncharacterized protein LOC118485908 [Helianthus annuus]